MITLGIADHPSSNVKCIVEAPEGTTQLPTPLTQRPQRAFSLIDTRSQKVVTNATAWIWCRGCVLETPLAGEQGEEVIRSWPESSAKKGQMLFDDQLDPEGDYLIIAIPCSAAIRFDESPSKEIG